MRSYRYGKYLLSGKIFIDFANGEILLLVIKA